MSAAPTDFQLLKAIKAEATPDSIRLPEFDWQALGEHSASLQALATDIHVGMRRSFTQAMEIAQRLHKAKADCPAEHWDNYCITLIPMKSSQIRDYIQTWNWWKDNYSTDLARLSTSVIIEIARKDVPVAAIEQITAQATKGTPVTVEAAKATIREARNEAQTSAHIAPGSYDHDVDRTHQAAEPSETQAARMKALRGIATTIKKIVKSHPDLRDAIADQLIAISDQVKHEQDITGLDSVTLKAVVS